MRHRAAAPSFAPSRIGNFHRRRDVVASPLNVSLSLSRSLSDRPFSAVAHLHAASISCIVVDDRLLSSKLEQNIDRATQSVRPRSHRV